MATATADRVVRRVEQLAARDLDAHAFRREAVEVLRAAVPFDAHCASSADPTSLALTSVVVEGHGLQREGSATLYALEHGPDFNRHRDLARAPRAAATLDEATGGRPERSRRYGELLEPMGVRHELRAALRVDAMTWGFLHLYRSDAGRAFDADELAVVEAAAVALGGALRDRAVAPLLDHVPADRAPALFLLDADNRLAEQTVGAGPQLDALRDPAAPDQAVPEVFLTLGVWARVLAAVQPGQSARARVPGADGRWHLLHAQGTSAGRVAITAQQAGPADLLPLLLDVLGVTRAERAVVELVLGGQSTKQIAATLFLSPYTVQDHLKSIFDKVGVRSRRDLVAKLSG